MPTPPKARAGADEPLIGQRVKLVLDAVRALVTIAFGLVGIYFLWSNWDELTALVTNLNRIEFAGVKAEFGAKGFADYDKIPNGNKGALKDEEFRTISNRALWMQPILMASQLLWVDDLPQNNNPELQLLSSYRINVTVAQSNVQALAEMKKRPFDLVVSSIPRPVDKYASDNIPLSICTVHWFEVPQRIREDEETRLNRSLKPDEKQALLDDWNKASNETPYLSPNPRIFPFAGFILAERIRKELSDPNLIPELSDPKVTSPTPTPNTVPVIFYTKFDQPISSKCGHVTTTQAYAFYQAVLETLEKTRWRTATKYQPPWLKDFVEKAKNPLAAIPAAAEKKAPDKVMQ